MNNKQPTKEDEEIKKAITHRVECMKKNISHCCGAPCDESIKTLQFDNVRSFGKKGHGIRYCSKCGNPLFMI